MGKRAADPARGGPPAGQRRCAAQTMLPRAFDQGGPSDSQRRPARSGISEHLLTNPAPAVHHTGNVYSQRWRPAPRSSGVAGPTFSTTAEAYPDGVTIREVARRAGVSVATVSRVLNNSGPASEAARHRIHAAAAELRYTPHGAARSLITRKTRTLGVLLPDIYGDFFSEVIRGIDQAVRTHDHHLLVSGSHNDTAEIEAALQAMRGRVDGLIVMSPGIDAPALAANLPENLPVVLLNCRPHGSSFDTLNIDNFAGAYAVTRHLVAVHGHRCVALIKGAERNYDAQERLRGYRAALEESGAECSQSWEIAGDFTESAGYAAVAGILELKPRPTAIFAANDAMAIGALSALREAGMRVPEDLAIVGFDDIPITRYVSPPLTSIQVAISEFGTRAVEQLMRASAAKNQHPRQQQILPTTLVVRRSCGCTPAADPAGD